MTQFFCFWIKRDFTYQHIEFTFGRVNLCAKSLRLLFALDIASPFAIGVIVCLEVGAGILPLACIYLAVTKHIFEYENIDSLFLHECVNHVDVVLVSLFQKVFFPRSSWMGIYWLLICNKIHFCCCYGKNIFVIFGTQVFELMCACIAW